MKKFFAYFSALLVVFAAAITLNFGISQSQAAGARDYDDNAIVRGGAYSTSELQSNYKGDVPAVYDAFGVTSGEVKGTSGTMKNGYVTKTGNVTVDGKVVATGALTVGRQNMTGSTRITVGGASYYKRAPSVSFKSSELEAFVYFDASGKFSGAVIKACGNPVTATPKPVPTAACKGIVKNIIARNQFSFDASASTADGATISGYVFTTTAAGGATVDTKTVNTTALTAKSGTVTIANPGTYTTRVTVKTSLGDRTGDGCAATYTVAPAPTPTAACSGVTKNIIARNQFSFDASASTSNGATVSGYVFTTTNSAGAVVDTKTVNTTALKANSGTVTLADGSYTTRVTVKTSLGDRTGDGCATSYTVTPAPQPGVTIEKTVDGAKQKRVTINGEYSYQLVVKNTGAVALKNVAVTDKPQTGITLISASIGTIANNEWKYSIAELAPQASVSITIKAKVPAYVAGNLVNTACVDATEVSGTPDKCDTATVDVPKPEEPVIRVCDLATDTVIEIKEKDFDAAKHSKTLADCDSMQVCELSSGTIITIKANDFDTTKHSKSVADCKIQVCELSTGTIITILKSEFKASEHSKALTDCDKIKVCELSSGNTITIKVADYDTQKHSKNPDDCKNITVCRLSDKQIATIKESAFDNTKYSRTVDDCKVASVTTTVPTPTAPEKIASTGPEMIIGGLVGSSALGMGVSSFVRSRNTLKNVLIARR